VSNPNSKTYSEVSFDANQDTFSKLVTLGKEQLRFEVAKPALNNINVYASLSDSNGNTLFYGNKTSRLVKTGDDGWKLPDNAVLVEMDAIDQLPIEFTGVTAAQFLARNADGQITNIYSFWVDRAGNRFSLPAYVADMSGEIRVWYQTPEGQRSKSFDVETGSPSETAVFTTQTIATIKNVFSFVNPAELIQSVSKENRSGYILEVVMTQEKVVPIFFDGATGFYLRMLGQKIEWTWFPFMENTMSFHFAPGRYDIIVQWPEEEINPFTPPMNSGGEKG
jgi:hypothetical protein